MNGQKDDSNKTDAPKESAPGHEATGSDPPSGRAKNVQIAELLARIARLENDFRNKAPTDRTFIGIVAAIVSSGFFFLLIGAGFLFLAQNYMATNHAGITFVLVVLGVALLLYGTGTQGMGQFGPAGGSAGYNVVIAGGAGIVAFAVAYGIIKYSPQMRDAFQPERKFVRVLVQGGDGLTNIAQYASTFDMDGVSIPAARKGQMVEVYVPYMPYEITKTPAPLPSTDQNAQPSDDKGICLNDQNRQAARQLDQRATTKLISGRFYRVEGTGRLDQPLQPASADFLVRFDERIFRSNDGGIDYPSYPVKICVNLQQSVDREKDYIAAEQLRQLSSQAGKLKPNLPPAILEAQ